MKINLFGTFEGLDRCGKGTQADLLIARLIKNGFNPHKFREPGGTKVGELIRNILLHTDLDMTPETELLLFNAARAQLQPEIREARLQGRPIFSERYYQSTYAYQGKGKDFDPRKIDMVVHGVIECVTPDIVFLLNITPQEMFERTRRINLPVDRIEARGISYYEKVAESYQEQASQNPDVFMMIDATQSIQAIHEQIWTKVSDFLPSSPLLQNT